MPGQTADFANLSRQSSHNSACGDFGDNHLAFHFWRPCRGGQPFSIRAECHAVDIGGVCGGTADNCLSRHVPEFHGAVPTCGSQSAAVEVEFQSINVCLVDCKRG